MKKQFATFCTTSHCYASPQGEQTNKPLPWDLSWKPRVLGKGSLLLPCHCLTKSLQSCFTTTANKQTNITKIKELSRHSSLCAFQCFRICLFWSKSGSRSRPFSIYGSGFNMDPGDMEKILTFELLDGFQTSKK